MQDGASHVRRHSEPVQDTAEDLDDLLLDEISPRRHSLADGEGVVAVPEENGVSHESQGGDGVHGISDASTVPREDVISSTKGLVARLKSASDGSVERRTSIGTTHEDVTEDFDLPTDDILFNLDKVPQKKDKVRERLSTGSTSSMSRAPLLLRLADLPSVGISLEQFTNNSALHFNHDKAVWEGNDEGVDLTGFPDETSPIERWDDEFEFLNDIKLSGSKAHIRRPSNASIGGGPTLITPQTRKQVLMSPNSDTSGKLNSGMYFDHAAQRWEGGDVDLSGFDVEDEAVPSSSSPRSKARRSRGSSEGKSPPKEVYDDDFVSDSYSTVQLPEKHRRSGSWMVGILSKFIGGSGTESADAKKSKGRVSDGPLLIRPVDVDTSLLVKSISTRSLGALSDELSALDGSDNNSRMEDWDEDLEGHLDVDKIRLQLKAVHFANLPLSPVPSDESTTSSKQASVAGSPQSFQASKRPSMVRVTKKAMLSPRKNSIEKKLGYGKPILITPDQAKAITHSNEMVFDKERNAWVERNCLPVDLDEMVDRTRHKKGNAGQTGSFDRRSKPEDFILDSHLKESFYTAEERHNDHMKQFLGPKDFGRMVSTGAYRLSMRSPLRYNTEDSVKRTLNPNKRSLDAVEDLLATPTVESPRASSASARPKGRERAGSVSPLRPFPPAPDIALHPAANTTVNGNGSSTSRSRPSSASSEHGVSTPKTVRTQSGGWNSNLRDPSAPRSQKRLAEQVAAATVAAATVAAAAATAAAAVAAITTAAAVGSSPVMNETKATGGGKKARAHLHQGRDRGSDRPSVTFDLSKTGQDRLSQERVSDTKVKVFKDIWDFAAEHFDAPTAEGSSNSSPPLAEADAAEDA